MSKSPTPIGSHEVADHGGNLHQKPNSYSSVASQIIRDHVILMTPYPVEPGHTLIEIVRLKIKDWKPEMRASASYVAEGADMGIVINKSSSIMDYNKTRAGQKERLQPPDSKISFKVSLINTETKKMALEHRTLRFWLDHSSMLCASNKVRNADNSSDVGDKEDYEAAQKIFHLKQDSSQLMQAFFRQLRGSKPDDFPKNYSSFIMKLMRILKCREFERIMRMEVELRQLAQEDLSSNKPASPVLSTNGSQSGRGSPITSQMILDVIESSYPNPISFENICSTIQADELLVKQLVGQLVEREKIKSIDEGQSFIRFTKLIDTNVSLVKQMPKVTRSQQPVIAIITAQYCEKLAVDSMISDKNTFVRYRVAAGQENPSQNLESSSNYVYTLGNIGDHRVVSTKLPAVGEARDALIASGNATTRLLGIFPEIEYVFLVGCGGGVVNYTEFSKHVRLGDVVISYVSDGNPCDTSMGTSRQIHRNYDNDENPGSKYSGSDYIYLNCRPNRKQDRAKSTKESNSNIPVSYSISKNLKKACSLNEQTEEKVEPFANEGSKSVDASLGCNNEDESFSDCQIKLWRPSKLHLQELAKSLWLQGLTIAKHRIWDYYIDDGIKTLKQLDIDASRPSSDSDKLFMSIGSNDTIEVSHPEPSEEEIDLRSEGRPMCHFGPIASGRIALSNERVKQQMISEFDPRAFDSEFDPVVESIHGNCIERYIIIRGIADYKDGRDRKRWQQYSSLAAAAFMKSIIVNLQPSD